MAIVNTEKLREDDDLREWLSRRFVALGTDLGADVAWRDATPNGRLTAAVRAQAMLSDLHAYCTTQVREREQQRLAGHDEPLEGLLTELAETFDAIDGELQDAPIPRPVIIPVDVDVHEVERAVALLHRVGLVRYPPAGLLLLSMGGEGTAVVGADDGAHVPRPGPVTTDPRKD